MTQGVDCGGDGGFQRVAQYAAEGAIIIIIMMCCSGDHPGCGGAGGFQRAP